MSDTVTCSRCDLDDVPHATEADCIGALQGAARLNRNASIRRKADRLALLARSEALEGVLRALLFRMRAPLVVNHACAECIPDGDVVVVNFRCSYHAARALLACATCGGKGYVEAKVDGCTCGGTEIGPEGAGWIQHEPGCGIEGHTCPACGGKAGTGALQDHDRALTRRVVEACADALVRPSHLVDGAVEDSPAGERLRALVADGAALDALLEESR